MVAGSLGNARIPPRSYSHSPPERTRCVELCHVAISLRWKRRPRLESDDELPINKLDCWILMEGAPIPRHPGQSCSSGAVSRVLLKKYEKRKSLTRVGRNTLVIPMRLWSDQSDWRVHCEGYGMGLPALGDGPKARLPSCE